MKHIEINYDNDPKITLNNNEFDGDSQYIYLSYFDQLASLYYKIQNILLISLNDIFLDENLKILKEDKLIKDTIEVIVKNNYDLNKILNANPNNNDKDFINENNQNLFLNYSKICEELLESELISIPKNISNSESNSKTRLKNKKNYEVEQLSRYMLEIINNEKIKNLIEMGCGKSYLCDSILIKEDMVYIGLDKKDDLIEKSNKKINKKENIKVIYHDITLDNFNSLFENQIETKLNLKEEENKNIMLFGLHSCGNLSSDTIKIFLQNDSFTHLVIIGCCLNLLKEYVSDNVKNESDLFKDYIKKIGYDNKGNFLEQTLLYEYDYPQVGFPLSQFILHKHKNLFLTRTVRNASMQTFPKNEDAVINKNKNLFYKKIFYRTILQSFFEEFFPDLKNFYGFGKIEIDLDGDFTNYLKMVFKNLNKILISDKPRLEKLKELEKNLMNKENSIVDDFFKRYEDNFVETILWAVYVIRLKFAKIVEYIIAMDRVMFLIEKGITNVKLVKIFDEKVSVRNILIYAKK